MSETKIKTDTSIISEKKPMEKEEVTKYLMSFYDGFTSWKKQIKGTLSHEMNPQKRALCAATFCPPPRNVVTRMVSLKENHGITDARAQFAERCKIAQRVCFNAFNFPSEYLSGIDALSDSGTTAMDQLQWAALMQGDEAYGSNRGWILLNETIAKVFGEDFGNPFLGLNADPKINARYEGKKNFCFLFHQARAAEHCLFEVLLQFLVMSKYYKREKQQQQTIEDMGEYYIGFNTAFDTTGANVINCGERVVLAPNNQVVKISLKLKEFLCKEMKNGTYTPESKFLGNCDYEEVKKFIEQNKERIPMFYLTVTNNKGGGQPVSLDHIRKMSELCHSNDIPLMFDACRFAENAWFIHRDEHPEMSIPEIVCEMFKCCDGFHISFKKDGLVNMGGGMFIKPNGLFAKRYTSDKIGEPCFAQMITDHQILTEGHPTYGGMNGRDIMALKAGLEIVTNKQYLDSRIGQVISFGQMLHDVGVPVLLPVGGSAVYINIDKFFDDTDERKLKRGKFLGVSLVAILLCFGHRLCELGAFAFSGPTAPNPTPESVPTNFVRIAIPRNMYSSEDLNDLCLILAYLRENRDKILPVLPLDRCQELSLHHFKSRFTFVSDN